MLKKNFRTSVIAVAIASLFSISVIPHAAADGITWTSRTSAADNVWNSVTYGNGLFVAVGESGSGNRVMTSPDGITWTSRASAADIGWFSVTYGNGLFVAVSWNGSGNQVMTSPDGVTWTSRASAANNGWNAVTYGDGLFVAVSFTGTGNRVMTSGEIGLVARIAAAKAAAAKAAEDAAAAAKAMQDQALVLGTLALAIGSIESGLSTLTVAATQKQGVGTHKVSKKLKKKAKTKK